MNQAVETPSGKGAGDENFPVGSWLLPARLRPHVAAFYRFARAIDDIADNPALAPADKIARLDRFAKAITGAETGDPALETAHRLRASLAETEVTAQHGLDLITAFKRDANKLRYDDWADLMGYCAYSANPVGRYLLDLHGEAASGYPSSDALCSALQVLNHLQDCQDDYRSLDRVYLPYDWLAAAGLGVEALDGIRCAPGLRKVLDRCLDGVEDLLVAARALPGRLRSPRLAMESAVILRLAERLAVLLRRGDPLAGRVALGRLDFLLCGLGGAGGVLLQRVLGGGRGRQPVRQGP
jgi:squalene synthase HpnC